RTRAAPSVSRLVSWEVISIPVTERSSWFILRLATEDGFYGFGEGSTGPEDEPAFEAAAAALAQGVMGQTLGRPAGLIERAAPATMPQPLSAVAAGSALEQALWDIAGKREQAPVWTFFGQAVRRDVDTYANINRALRNDRSPTAFAEVAAAA